MDLRAKIAGHRFDQIIAVGIMIAISFTVLAHGAVEPWTIAVFEFLIILLLLGWVIKSVVIKQIEIKLPLTFWPIAAFLIYGIIQSITITDSNGNFHSLSYDVEATQRAVTILFFLLAAHIIAANVFKRPESLIVLANFLTVFGFIVAVFGFIQFFTWNGNLYWIRPVHVTSSGVIGPFVSHNHFAGFLNLLIPFPVALILTGNSRKFTLFYGFAAVIMAMAVIASVSRGGIVSLLGGLIFIFAARVWQKRLNQRLHNRKFAPPPKSFASNALKIIPKIVAAIIFLGAIGVGAAWIGLDPVVERISSQSLENARGVVWRNSFNVFAANPVYGAGLGAFNTAFPKTSNIDPGELTLDRAHNDYLQVLTDTGVIGGILEICFIIIIILCMVRGLRLINPEYMGFALAGSAAIFTIMIHSIFDFNLQIPSNALIFLTVSGILAALTGKIAKSETLASDYLTKEKRETAVAAANL